MHADESHASPEESLAAASAAASAAAAALAPAHLDLDREKGLAITWADGRESFFPIAYLRRRSPSADAKVLREEMARNPLTVLPASRATTVSFILKSRKLPRFIFSRGAAFPSAFAPSSPSGIA